VDFTGYPMEPLTGAFNGYPEYEALSEAEKIRFSWTEHAQIIAQFLHDGQGAMIVGAMIVGAMIVASQLVTFEPTADAKLYAGSGAFNDPHIKAFKTYLSKRCGALSPINDNLKALIDNVFEDPRWAQKFIGMQLIIEGLTLAAFGTIAQTTRDPLLKQAVKLMMRNEGRHVAFSFNYLEDWIKTLPQEEIEDWAEFAYQASLIMRDRLFGLDVAREYGFDLEKASANILQSQITGVFQHLLVKRLSPNFKRAGCSPIVSGRNTKPTAPCITRTRPGMGSSIGKSLMRPSRSHGGPRRLRRREG
jgi:hypothetical protein